MNFSSKAMCHGSCIDERRLHMGLMFYQLTLSEIIEVMSLIQKELSELFRDSTVCLWYWGTKVVKEERIRELINSHSNSKGGFDFGFEGEFLSEIVYDRKTLKEYNNNMKYACMSVDGLPVGYMDEFDRYFKKGMSKEELKQALLEFMNMPNKKLVRSFPSHDIQGVFFVNPYLRFPGLYCGRCFVSVVAGTLNLHIDEFAKKFERIVRKVAQQSSNVSGCVSLEPQSGKYPCFAHMKVFGGRLDCVQACREMGYEEYEWTPYSYVCGTEWFNLISPLQRERLPDVLTKSKAYEKIYVEEVGSGGLIVGSNEPISQTDIPELREIKELVYDALYPGKSVIYLDSFWERKAFGFRAKPRSGWEYVPIFEDEIFVLFDRIEFRHKQK